MAPVVIPERGIERDPERTVELLEPRLPPRIGRALHPAIVEVVAERDREIEAAVAVVGGERLRRAFCSAEPLPKSPNARTRMGASAGLTLKTGGGDARNDGSIVPRSRLNHRSCSRRAARASRHRRPVFAAVMRSFSSVFSVRIRTRRSVSSAASDTGDRDRTSDALDQRRRVWKRDPACVCRDRLHDRRPHARRRVLHDLLSQKCIGARARTSSRAMFCRRTSSGTVREPLLLFRRGPSECARRLAPVGRKAGEEPIGQRDRLRVEPVGPGGDASQVTG